MILDFSKNILDTRFQRVSEIESNALLAPKSEENNQNGIPFVLTYNKTLPNVKQIINKHWHLLQISSNLKTAVEQEPIIVYIQNKNFDDRTASNQILDNKTGNRNNGMKQLYYRPCLARKINSCCQQVSKTNIFTSYRTGETFKNCHQLNCTSSYLIYSPQC